MRAEREGCDACIIGHFQDAGLYEARSVVKIPVVPLGEASMLYSCQLGQRIGIVTMNTRYIPLVSPSDHEIRMQFEPGQILKSYESQKLADEMRDQFAAQARPLVAGGCEVLILAGGIPSCCFPRFASTGGRCAGH